MKTILLLLVILSVIISCENSVEKPDAFGVFEPTEITFLSQSEGKLLFLSVIEGQTLDAGQIVGLIDTTMLLTKRYSLADQKFAITSRMNNIFSHLALLEEQLENAHKDKKRIEFLFKDGAASQKEIDDINARIELIKIQLNSIENQNQTVINEVKGLDSRINSIDKMLSRSLVKNPDKGKVAAKFVADNDSIKLGQALYKINEEQTMTLRAYFTKEQLLNLQVDQKLKIRSKDGEHTLGDYIGVVSWIAPETEKVPASIKNKNEKLTDVYAVHIIVKNDGRIIEGMTAEVMFFYRKD